MICISMASEVDSCQGFGRHGDEYNGVPGGPEATKKFQRVKNAVKRKERKRQKIDEREGHSCRLREYYRVLQYLHLVYIINLCYNMSTHCKEYCSICTSEDLLTKLQGVSTTEYIEATAVFVLQIIHIFTTAEYILQALVLH